jgi:hypothetical protein
VEIDSQLGIRGRRAGAAIALVLVIVGAARAAVAEPPPATVWKSLGGLAILGPGPDYASVGLGAFDVVGTSEGRGVANRSAAMRIEYRRGREKLWFLGPMLGLMANTDGGIYGYGGVHAEAVWGRLALTPFGAIGGYREGHSKDLGSTFLFRAGIGASYQLASRARVGVEFAHLSNGYTRDINPGEEELYLTLALPF